MLLCASKTHIRVYGRRFWPYTQDTRSSSWLPLLFYFTKISKPFDYSRITLLIDWIALYDIIPRIVVLTSCVTILAHTCVNAKQLPWKHKSYTHDKMIYISISVFFLLERYYAYSRTDRDCYICIYLVLSRMAFRCLLLGYALFVMYGSH